ncbi:hypothetical protein PGB90_009042 [Kerria lacca]
MVPRGVIIFGILMFSKESDEEFLSSDSNGWAEDENYENLANSNQMNPSDVISTAVNGIPNNNNIPIGEFVVDLQGDYDNHIVVQFLLDNVKYKCDLNSIREVGY